MQRRKALKIGMLALLMLVGSLASVMYALAYSEKRELIYSNTITIEGKEVKFPEDVKTVHNVLASTNRTLHDKVLQRIADCKKK